MRKERERLDIESRAMAIEDITSILNRDIIQSQDNENGPNYDYTFKNYLQKAREKNDMKKIFGTFFQSGELCILAGKAGTGKTILAYQIADGITRGERILEQENEFGPQIVLYYDFELNEMSIKKRFTNYEPNRNFLRPDISKLILKYNGIFSVEIIEKDIEITGANVIIIDNITAMALKNLQDYDETLRIMRDLMILKNSKDVSILLVAHTPKLKENRPLELYDISGASLIHNFVDSAIMLGKSAKNINYRYIKQVKNRNDFENDKVLTIEITNQDWLHYDFVDYDTENAHLLVDAQREKMKKGNLIEIAKSIINSDGISFSEFCNRYAEKYNKSPETGKRVLKQMLGYKVISKENGKYTLNWNETEFSE